MTGASPAPPRPWRRAAARWVASLALVLAAHAGALALLRHAMPQHRNVPPTTVVMDLAPLSATQGAPIIPAIPAPVVAAPPPAATLQPAPQPSPQAVPVQAPRPPTPQEAARAPEAPEIANAALPLPPSPPPAPSRRPHPRPPPRPYPPPPVSPSPASGPPAQTAAPSPPVIPSQSAAATQQAQTTWQGELVARLARFRRYPPEAQRRGEEGVVLMRMVLNRGGQVLSMAMAHSSGHADLDAEASAWIERAEPFPPFPPEFTASPLVLMVPLRFTLR